MIHPDTAVLWISDAAGYAVVATRRIPRGTFVWVFDRLDALVRRDEVRGIDGVHRVVLERYGHKLEGGDWVLCWDDARLICESAEPSLRRVGRSGMIAQCDLRPGDVLSVDSLDASGGVPSDDDVTALRAVARAVAQPLLASLLDGSEVEDWFCGPAEHRHEFLLGPPGSGNRRPM